MALCIPKVRARSEADQLALQISLFRNGRGKACGCYIGPLTFVDGGVTLPYLPRSDEMLATVAVARAITIAAKNGLRLCLIDPEDLWESIWFADCML